MERFCVSHDCHRLGCDVEMVQSNVGEWVRYDDASAEIAKLRAEAEAVTKARDGACQQRDWWREQADAARAALDGEREACLDAVRLAASLLVTEEDPARGQVETMLANTMRRHANDAAGDA